MNNAKLLKHSPPRRDIKPKDEYSPITNYSKVLTRLYLGNIQSARDYDFMKAKNIAAVLNCSRSVDIPNYYASKGLEYLRIPVDDSLRECDFAKMTQLLPLAVEYINKHLNIERCGKLLVHCYAGRQRSAICVAAYLVKYHNMTPIQAVKYIQDKRQEAFHHGQSINFEKSLNTYYKSINPKAKKSDLVGGYIY